VPPVDEVARKHRKSFKCTKFNTFVISIFVAPKPFFDFSAVIGLTEHTGSVQFQYVISYSFTCVL